MIQYWIPLALLTVVAMLFVLVPLWRLRKHESVRALHVREEKNREIFAERQQELEHEVREGTIAPEDFQRLLAELQRAFLTDMQGLQTLQSAEPQRQTTLWWVPLVLALMIPVAAAVLYRSKGSAPDLQLPALMQQIRAAEDKDGQLAALDKLTVFLAERLERRPKDIQNGYMLGTIYLEMERPQDAIPVFRKMLANMKPGPDRAVVLGQMAQAMFLQDNKKTLTGTEADSQQVPTLVISAETRAVMEEAIALNPNEKLVMGIYAVDAYFKRDFVTAVKYWRRQLSDLQPGSAEAGQLRQRIATMEANLPEDQKAAAQGPRLSVVINIAPELAGKVSEDMKLFVYARNPAMKMPIAARNEEVPPGFPVTITLDNSNSMTGMQLESVPQLVVGARLSRSGTAIAQSGDLEILSAPFVLKDLSGPLTLTINKIVP